MPIAKQLFADGAYDRAKLMDKAVFLAVVIEVVSHVEGLSGFHILLSRWAAERTFGWMGR